MLMLIHTANTPFLASVAVMLNVNEKLLGCFSIVIV